MIAALVRGYFARQAWQRRQLAKQRIAGLLRSWLLVRRLSAQRLRRAASARLMRREVPSCQKRKTRRNR
jgi:hypothetical protein